MDSGVEIALTDEQAALASAIRAWAEAGADPVSLTGAEGIGLAGIAVPEELGGAGGTVTDLVAGVAAAAEALAQGPLFGTLVAGLVLTRCPDSRVAKELLPSLADGSAAVSVAFGPGELRAARSEDGGFVVSGRSALVADAGTADDAERDVLLCARLDDEHDDTVVWFLVRSPGKADTAEAFDPTRTLGRLRLDHHPVPADAVVSGSTASGVPAFDVDSLLATVAAAEAAGVASWCVRTASEYARVREQFGTPIGAFQAVKHLCAEMLCRAESAAALVWDAARAADESPNQHALAAAVAAADALDAAVANAKDCIQVLGGIGFTWEHDAHRFLRRAVSLRQLLGGSARWRVRAGELTRAGTRRLLDVDADAYADAVTTDDIAEARQVADELAALDIVTARTRLAETGYLAPHWPKPYGLDASPARQLLIDAELRRAGVRRPDLIIGAWAVPTILEHGSAEQRERFVGPTLHGELTWCQLFSEPGAGSDLAALRTRAERVDHPEGGWRLHGQKVWTSLAHEADWAICLARTDPDAPKHKGITYFLVDMRSEGLDIRPLREITGETRFNEVFLDGVFVPDADVVGEVDGGWRLARTTLANERVALGGGSSVGEAVEELLALHPDFDAERLGELVVRGSALSVLALRDTLRRLGGHAPGAESSVRKLLGVRHRQDVAEAALEALGPAAAAVEHDARPTVAAQHEFLLSRCLSIAGGTTQVLLNVVGERLLGLPRS